MNTSAVWRRGMQERISRLTARVRALETVEIYPDEVDAWRSAIGAMLLLPGLRLLAPCGSFSATPEVMDLSAQERHLTVVDATFSFDGLIPYALWNINAPGGILSRLTRADEVGLNIRGNEAIIEAAARGLTLGGLFWPNSLGGATGTQGLICKGWTGADDRAYSLTFEDDNARFEVSETGTAATVHTVTSSTTSVQQTWQFVAGRYDPGAELAIFVNHDKDVNIASIPASINASAEDLHFGVRDNIAAVDTFYADDSRMALLFLCTCAVPDDTLYGLASIMAGLSDDMA